MSLYDRDFSEFLNEEEKNAQHLQENFDNTRGFKRVNESPKNKHDDIGVRKFLWHYNSLFPNNYLWYMELKQLDLEKESQLFSDVIYSVKTENEIQTYIKENKKWFIPASLFKEYNFAHHGAYIFPEMRLGSEYKADYGLVGKNSDGYHIVLVEFEKADVEFKLKNQNSESESVRKGLTQIRDWKRWIDSNRAYFLRTYKFTDKGIDIPSYHFHYCVVVGRRDRMNEAAYDLKSQLSNEYNNLKIVTFDRLVDNISKLGNGY